MSDNYKIKNARSGRRINRVRAKLFGTGSRPRLSVFRSSRHLDLQLIDDEKAVTIVSVKDSEVKLNGKPLEIAHAAGKLIAEKAIAKGIKTIIFDRRASRYHGRVKEVAEGAREAGLEF